MPDERLVQMLTKQIQIAGGRSVTPFKYGWNEKSAGVGVIIGNTRYWFRTQFRDASENPSRLWLGEQNAQEIAGVKKPQLLKSIEDRSGNIIYRTDVLSYVRFKVCSDTQELNNDFLPSRSWLAQLDESLRALSRIKTDRVSFRQDLVTRRVAERFGNNFDPRIENWQVVHGDVHFANLTEPECYLLDWESWGNGPYGADIAFLFCFSLTRPRVSRVIYDYFRSTLESKSGKLSLAFACSELLRMGEQYGDHPTLMPGLNRLERDLRNGVLSY